MKNLILSVICMLVLIVPWGFFENYSAKTINRYTTTLNSSVIPAIESGDWQTAEDKFVQVMKDWETYKAVSAYFLNTSSANDIDGQISKTYYYIRANDRSNAAGEVSSLSHSLYYLHENEQPSGSNLF